MNEFLFSKLGVYEKAIPLAFDWNLKFQTAKEAGFDFIEFSIDGLVPRIDRLKWSNEKFINIRKIAESFSMFIPSIALTANRYFPLGDPDNACRDKGIEIVKRTIEIAELLGSEIIQLAAYDVNGKKSTDSTKERFREAIISLAHNAKKANVVLAIEILEDVPHFSTIEQGVDFVRKLGNNYVRLYADTGNTASIGIIPHEDLKYDKGEVVCCHIKDALLGNCRNVPFGAGIVDFTACFKHFEDRNYNGNFVAELWCDEDESFIPYLSEVSKFIRKHIKGN